MTEERGLRRIFDSAADLYQRARPEYPEQLYEAMIAAAGLHADDRLLEIACASGKNGAAGPPGLRHHVRRSRAGAGRRRAAQPGRLPRGRDRPEHVRGPRPLGA